MRRERALKVVLVFLRLLFSAGRAERHSRLARGGNSQPL
jgi:hypothetical protein